MSVCGRKTALHKKSWAVIDRPYSLGCATVGALYEPVNELQSSAIPLLASPQGGVAASSIRYCEATEAAAAGVVFLLVFDRKTTPASRSAEASRYFVTRSATPLRLRAAALALRGGDARRGICSIPICSQLHRAPLQLGNTAISN